MIPLRDTLKTERVPWVTRSLLAINVVVFAVQFLTGRKGEVLVQIFGVIPARLWDPARFDYSWAEVALTLVTSLFLHGGFVHLAGNMIYLWIFGDDVEDRLGHVGFAAFFVACGAAGSLMHAYLFAGSTIPSIGASGSIAGILGAFLMMHPRAKIVTLVPLVVSWLLVEIPAVVFLPVWFAMQFLNGWLALASASAVQEVAGIAWWAHIGGFSCGVLMGLRMMAGTKRVVRAANQ